MEKTQTVTQAEWPIMELLWEAPRTLMEIVSALCAKHAWSKSTVTTMVRRMAEKGLIIYHTEGRTKIFRPAVSRDDVTARETHSLLRRAYNGSVGLLVSAMADRNDLTKSDIDELYAILKQAKENAK